DLPKACQDYERQLGGGASGGEAGVIAAYRAIEARAYQITAASGLTGRPVKELLPGMRVFVECVRRGNQIINADGDTVLQDGDVIAMSGRREQLVEQMSSVAKEVQDRELLDSPAELLDVLVTNKAYSGMSLRMLSEQPFARGVYLRKIVRSLIEI